MARPRGLSMVEVPVHGGRTVTKIKVPDISSARNPFGSWMMLSARCAVQKRILTPRQYHEYLRHQAENTAQLNSAPAPQPELHKPSPSPRLKRPPPLPRPSPSDRHRHPWAAAGSLPVHWHWHADHNLNSAKCQLSPPWPTGASESQLRVGGTLHMPVGPPSLPLASKRGFPSGLGALDRVLA